MAKGLAHAILQDVKRVADLIGDWPTRNQYRDHPQKKFSTEKIEEVFGSWTEFNLAAGKAKIADVVDEGQGPKVLFIDIETFPAKYYAYEPRVDYLRRGQMIEDVGMRSWCAKWLGSPELIYRDTRDQENKRDAAPILDELWQLMNEADIIIGQNSDKFDIPKIQGWFVHFNIRDRHPPSPFKKVDTKKIVKKHFGLTYNSLEHMAEFFGVEHKKLKHEAYPDMMLPVACEAGDLEAWKVNEEYNKVDVICLEECWTVMRAWDSSVNQNLYTAGKVCVCHVPGCGGDYVKNGHYYLTTGKYQRYSCDKCGHPARGRENLLSKRKKENMRLSAR